MPRHTRKKIGARNKYAQRKRFRKSRRANARAKPANEGEKQRAHHSKKEDHEQSTKASQRQAHKGRQGRYKERAAAGPQSIEVGESAGEGAGALAWVL